LPTEGQFTGQQRIPLPIGGAANLSAFREQPNRFCPPSTLRSVRPYDVGTDRPRIGTTPGIAPIFDQTFGDGNPVQDINTVSRASVVAGYHLGVTTPIAGRSSLADPLTGQVFGLSSANPPLLEWAGTSALSSIAASCVARHPDTDLTVVAGTDTSGTDTVKVAALNRYGATVWSVTISEGGVDRFVNTLAMSRLYTFVATNNKVLALRNDTGATAATSTCNGWAKEVIDLVVWRDPSTGEEFLFVLFDGSENSTGSGNLPNGTALTAGFYARCFRSGVMKFLVPSSNYSATPVFGQVQFGPQLPSTATYYESAHGYFRISEQSELKPRGCIPTALAVDGLGNLYVTRCNAGGGPNNTFTPDLTQVRPITVMRINRNGTKAWEIDTDSIIRVGPVGGYLNDIPNSSSEDPSVQAVAADEQGTHVYAAGAPNAAQQCVFALRASDGALIWTQEIEPVTVAPTSSIRQAAARVDPTDGGLILGGDYTNNWDGATVASFWKLSAETGEFVWSVALNATAYGFGVAVFRNGRVVLVGSHF